MVYALRWRHNERNGVSNRRRRNFLLKRLFRHKSKKTSKLRVTGLCTENSPVSGEIPAQMASNAKNVSIWWRHHGRNRPSVPTGNYEGKSCCKKCWRNHKIGKWPGLDHYIGLKPFHAIRNKSGWYRNYAPGTTMHLIEQPARPASTFSGSHWHSTFGNCGYCQVQLCYICLLSCILLEVKLFLLLHDLQK